jgi:preprotein translocase subunit SecA
MLDIARGVPVHKPVISPARITRVHLFQRYRRIVGMTGTAGSEGDVRALWREYGIIVFRVPRHVPWRGVVSFRDRPASHDALLRLVLAEIEEQTAKGRPVLVTGAISAMWSAAPARGSRAGV